MDSLVILFILLISSGTLGQEEKTLAQEETTPSSANERTESSYFLSFFQNDDSFTLTRPQLQLEPTKFAINDKPRNFVLEAIQRSQSKVEKIKEKSEIIQEESNIKERKKRHISSPGGIFFFNRPVFDGLFFNDIGSKFLRDSRKARRPPSHHRPVYPPVDPFGTTEYIPLPGASNPAYALPITSENPHFSRTPYRFRRPIRQVQYFNFQYDSSLDFYNAQNDVLRQIKSIP